MPIHFKRFLLPVLLLFSLLPQAAFATGFVNFTSTEGESFKIKYDDPRNTESDKSSTIVFEGNNIPLFKLYQRESLSGLPGIFGGIESDNSGTMSGGYIKGGIGIYAVCNIEGSDCIPFKYMSEAISTVTAGDGITIVPTGRTRTVSWNHTATDVVTLGANKIVHTNDNDDNGIELNAAGDLTVTAAITAGGAITSSSDLRLKTKVRPLVGSLAKIERLQGVEYEWLNGKRGRGKQVGLIAQDVEDVYPQFVKNNDDGYKSVNYAGIVAPLIEAVKELSARVEELEAELAALK